MELDTKHRISVCCAAPVENGYHGKATLVQWYVCTKCKEPCDTEQSLDPEFAKGLKVLVAQVREDDDDPESWPRIETVYLVPQDFDDEADLRQFVQTVKASGKVKLTKSGHIVNQHLKKTDNLYREDLK